MINHKIMKVEYKKPSNINFNDYELTSGPLLMPSRGVEITKIQSGLLYISDIFNEYLKEFYLSVEGKAEIDFKKVQYIRHQETDEMFLLSPYVKITTDYGFSSLYIYPTVRRNLVNTLHVDGCGIAEKTAIKCFSSIEKTLGTTRMIFKKDGKKVLPQSYFELPDCIKECIDVEGIEIK